MKHVNSIIVDKEIKYAVSEENVEAAIKEVEVACKMHGWEVIGTTIGPVTHMGQYTLTTHITKHVSVDMLDVMLNVATHHH